MLFRSTGASPIDTSSFLSANCSGVSDGSDGCLDQENPSSAQSTTWTVDAAVAPGTYTIKVKVWNFSNQPPAGVGSVSNQFTVNVATLPPPNLVKPLTGDTLAPLPNGEVGLRWEEVSGASGYRLYIDITLEVNIPDGQTVYNASGLGIGAHKWKACTLNASNQCGTLSNEETFNIQDSATGFVARTVNDIDVYWIMYGKKWKFVDQTTFFGLGYTDAEIQWFESGSLDSLPLGNNILANDQGFCYRSQDNETVYVIENGESHPFFQWDNFLGQGFTEEDIYWAKPEGAAWIQSIYPVIDAPMIRVEPENLNF